LETFARTYDQIQNERRAAAGGEVDALLQKTPTEKLPELVENPILRTLGALEYLGTIFNNTLANDPKRAKAVAELEISLAENLPQHPYHHSSVAQMRAYAWRDLGMAHRALGRLQESLDAFAVAENDLLPHGALVHDLAIVHLSVAVTLQEVERFDEARNLLAQSKRIFIQHADDKRLVLATLSEGLLLQRLRYYREAREVYKILLSSSVKIEPPAMAAIHRAVGLCALELGDFPDAEANLLRAIALNQQLAHAIDVARGKAALGRLLIRRGDAPNAISYLRPVRREFLQHGLIEEAGICGLEVVEGMLALGNFTGAETLSRKIIAEFVKAGLNKRAISALGYLHEAIASSKASTALASTVREYIVSLRTAPERDFLPRELTVSGQPPEP
jgi:tetratricopeptide (TPR) repeat protein